MYGQPAWFGSYGHDGWAGAGEAVPRLIMHEVSHSYWGEFAVEGRPELDWAPAQGSVPAALAQYRRDLETFLRQPPDRFEPLRDRFRNMPRLSAGDYPDLWHHGEADMVYFTGGDLDLIPPILRKYYSSFLTSQGVTGGGVDSWASAIAWWRGLDSGQRRAAGEVFGLQHFPLDRYTLPATPGARLPEHVQASLAGEERQRLLDFAEQFDLIKSREFALVDAAGVDRGFGFWRNYLSEMKELHRTYPDVLGRHDSDGAQRLGGALDFYISIERLSPASQVERYRARASDTNVRELAVLLKERAIIELFGAGAQQDTGVEAVIGHYASKLGATAVRVDAVLAAGRESVTKGAAELERYLGTLSDREVKSDAGVIFDLLRETDAGLTARIMPAMSDTVLLRLLALQPAAARSQEIGPVRLLVAAGIVPGASVEAVAAGAKTLAQNTSGNFAIDLPYELAVFDVIEKIGEGDPVAAVKAIAESGLRLDPWTGRGSTEMLSIFSRAKGASARLIGDVQGPRASPQRVIHSIAGLDPELAAALLAEMAAQGRQDVASRALLEMAYDAYWRSLGARTGVGPALDARFIAALERLNGRQWLLSTFDEALSLVRAWTASGEVEQRFETELRRTLTEAAGASTGDTAALIGELLRR
jgi:hypothetical protein